MRLLKGIWSAQEPGWGWRDGSAELTLFLESNHIEFPALGSGS